MGRQRGNPSVTREQIIRRAIEIADADGVTELTIRGLTRSLSLPPMSIYGHFESRDHVLDAMADALLGSMEPPPVTDGMTPTQYVLALAGAFRELMSTHPCVAYLFSSRTTFAKDSLYAAMELPIRGLIEVGFDPDDAVRVYGTVLTYVLGFQMYVLPRPWGDDPEHRRQQRARYETLPLPQFDVVVEQADKVALLPSTQQFEFSMRVLADALGALAGDGAR